MLMRDDLAAGELLTLADRYRRGDHIGRVGCQVWQASGYFVSERSKKLSDIGKKTRFPVFGFLRSKFALTRRLGLMLG